MLLGLRIGYRLAIFATQISERSVRRFGGCRIGHETEMQNALLAFGRCKGTGMQLGKNTGAQFMRLEAGARQGGFFAQKTALRIDPHPLPRLIWKIKRPFSAF